MNRTLLWLVGLPTAALAAACNGQVDVGEVPREAGTAGEAGSSDGPPPSHGQADSETDASVEASLVDSGPNPLSGTYSGYIESFQFPDGSDSLVLKLTFSNDGGVSGTVQFGGAPLLSPPTDANIGYPPNLLTTQPTGLLEGFDFTILAGTYAAPRVQFSLDNKELWKQWCELQTTIYPFDNGQATPDASCGQPVGYGCLPNGGTMFGGPTCSLSPCTSSGWMTVDCGKLQLCRAPGNVCTCTAASCTVPVPATGPTAFDMQLTSGALNGSVTGLGIQAFNVHLTRSP